MNSFVVLGDYNPGYPTHIALDKSINHCRKSMGININYDWISTDEFDFKNPDFAGYKGLWVAPGSPYRNMNKVLENIKFARINNIPTFGNCGGFQHMILEFARNVCGIHGAGHEETDPGSPDLVISELSCSLVGKSERLEIIYFPSIISGIIGQKQFEGNYLCNYGLNKQYIKTLAEHGCVFTVMSSEGEIRAFELKDHPFFLGTLFQPALNSSNEFPNPLILAFIKKCFE